MFKRLAAVAVLLWTVSVPLEAADQVLVQPADRERLIRLQDGRQIRLPAGTELVRSPDGRLLVRRPAPQSAAPKTQLPPEPRKTQSAAAPKESAAPGGWVWFAGVEAAQRTIGRDWKISTEEINGTQVILPGGSQVDLDGRTYGVSLKESSTGFALVGGLKDEAGENSYQATYQMDSELSELYLSAQFGFPSLSPVESLIPYLRIAAAAGFRDGITSFEANAFAYGFGAGATYPVNDRIETYFGLDMITRKWGDVIARDASVGTYGIEKVEDSETRFYLGARYYFR